mmetsp:Transcript_3871/g.7807  ORF Transcript_3871/g.7807 Transcript_3871/m.7807 type:complete len:264 (-) Transcript_3871:195-986(-)
MGARRQGPAALRSGRGRQPRRPLPLHGDAKLLFRRDARDQPRRPGVDDQRPPRRGPDQRRRHVGPRRRGREACWLHRAQAARRRRRPRALALQGRRHVAAPGLPREHHDHCDLRDPRQPERAAERAQPRPERRRRRQPEHEGRHDELLHLPRGERPGPRVPRGREVPIDHHSDVRVRGQGLHRTPVRSGAALVGEVTMRIRTTARRPVGRWARLKGIREEDSQGVARLAGFQDSLGLGLLRGLPRLGIMRGCARLCMADRVLL